MGNDNLKIEMMSIKLLLHRRRCGNTTRQVDMAVQDLFLKGTALWRDHAERKGNMAQEHGFKILLDRLWNEHRLDRETGLVVDRREFRVSLAGDYRQYV